MNKRIPNLIASCCRFLIMTLAISLPVAVSAQEPLKEPQFYMERLLEYYQGIETVRAEFETIARKSETLNQVVSTSDITKSYRYFKSGEKQRQEEGSPENFLRVSVSRDDMMKVLNKEQVGPPQMAIQPDQGGRIGKARDGYQLFFKNIEALAIWHEKPEILKGHDLSVKYFTEPDGRQTIEVVVFTGNEERFMRRTFRLDPSRGYVPVVLDVECKDMSLSFHKERIVRDYVDAGNGLLAPSQIEETFHSEEAGRVAESFRTTRVSRVVFNQPVDDSLFDLLPEPGTLVADSIGNVSYQVPEPEARDINIAGRSLGARKQPGQSLQQPPTQPPVEPPRQDVSWERKRPYWLAVMIAIIAAAVLAVGVGIRKKKNRKSLQ
ncbi:MAG TPA: hypothetical protein VMZ06_08440 [Candidatus Bathyarchaeia archaeon]|nr:hypothetical protein [Candidatus Bathyarchaeia archaeon]